MRFVQKRKTYAATKKPKALVSKQLKADKSAQSSKAVDANNEKAEKQLGAKKAARRRVKVCYAVKSRPPGPRPRRPAKRQSSLCQGVYVSGKNKGQTCTKKAEDNGYCGYHQSQAQPEEAAVNTTGDSQGKTKKAAKEVYPVLPPGIKMRQDAFDALWAVMTDGL